MGIFFIEALEKNLALGTKHIRRTNMNLKIFHTIFFGLIFASTSFDALAVRVHGTGRFADQFPPWAWILIGIANIGISMLFFKSDSKFDAQVAKASNSNSSSNKPSESEIKKAELKNMIYGIIFFSIGGWSVYMGLS